MDKESVDSDMLAHLDLLMDFELVKKETDWSQIELLDQIDLPDDVTLNGLEEDQP